MSAEHSGEQFDRLPATEAEREVSGRPTREEVVEYFVDRFGISPTTFDPYSFWEKGKGKVWAFRGELITPVPVEALGIHLLRTRQRFWKPTTDGMQLIGRAVSRNRIELPREEISAFWRGETQAIEWDGEPGYVVVTQQLGGDSEPLGVGLVVDGELRSMVPKGRRRDIPDP